MNIPKGILKKWKGLKSSRDIAALASLTQKSRMTISRALNDGECSVEVFVVISDFYKQREELLLSPTK